MGKRKLFVFWACLLAWWPLLLPPAQELTKEYKYVASKFSVYYHLPTCKRLKRIQVENMVFFTSTQDAIKAGFIPCGLCKPPDKDPSKEEEILKKDPGVLIPIPTN